MKFSFLIGTLNRSHTIMHCVDSLLNQKYSNFEIIIIDQSTNNETEKLIRDLNNSQIVYEHVDFTGLSKARNRALQIATGDYVSLVDDDAFYYADYLEKAYYHLKDYANENTILSGYIYDTDTDADFAGYNSHFDNKVLPYRIVLKTCPSAGLIIPMSAFNACGVFDENLGVGAAFGAGEETDFLIRAMEKRFSIKYYSDMRLKHPFPPSVDKQRHEDLSPKMYSYYSGIGALYKKHLFSHHNRKMLLPFIEMSMKFIAKNALKKKLNVKKIDNETKGLLFGLNNYKEL